MGSFISSDVFWRICQKHRYVAANYVTSAQFEAVRMPGWKLFCSVVNRASVSEYPCRSVMASLFSSRFFSWGSTANIWLLCRYVHTSVNSRRAFSSSSVPLSFTADASVRTQPFEVVVTMNIITNVNSTPNLIFPVSCLTPGSCFDDKVRSLSSYVLHLFHLSKT